MLVSMKALLQPTRQHGFAIGAFNVADSCLTVGCILLIVDALFLKEKSLFERVSFSKPAKSTPAGDKKDA